MDQVRARDVLPQLRAQQAAGQQPLLLDVREPWEVALASVQVSVQADGVPVTCIPMQEVPARLDTLPNDQPVWVLCHHGMRSAQMAGFLERRGFSQVYNIAGGIEAWALDVDAQVPRY